jgi:predicted ferric reductase
MVALVLFTLVVSLGTFVANRIGGTVVGRFEINELHRSLSMTAMTFLGFHITTTVIDSYVSTGLISVFVPFTSSYKTLPVAIGAVAFDLFLAVWVSSLLKVRLKNATWRFIHWFSWLGYATSIVHGYLTGTDSRHSWGIDVVIACTAVGVIAALWRFFGRPTRAGGRTALSPLSMPHPNKKTVQAPYVPSAPGSRQVSRDGFSRQPLPKRKKGRH